MQAAGHGSLSRKALARCSVAWCVCTEARRWSRRWRRFGTSVFALLGCAAMARRLAPGFRISASFNARWNGDLTFLATLGKRITLWDVESHSRIVGACSLRGLLA